MASKVVEAQAAPAARVLPDTEIDPTLPRGVLRNAEGAARRREHAWYAVIKNAGFLIALFWIVTQPSGWLEWSCFLVFYCLNVLGMSMGYHRYFTHKAFETSKPMRYLLGALAQLGVYGSLLRWCADHMRHHANTDRAGDVHSPYVDGFGRAHGGVKGFRHAHLGWAFEGTVTDLEVYGRSLAKDPVVMFYHRTRALWFFVSALVIPVAWALAFRGLDLHAIVGTVLIGGLFRLQLALHAIAAVNSFGHRFGRMRYAHGNHRATNLWFLGLITLGEGFHNNHHQYPNAARAGLAWYEIDVTWYVILALEKLGLVWNVRRGPKLVRDASGRWVDARQ